MIDTFRKKYTPLNDTQKAQMEEVKELADQLDIAMGAVLASGERSDRGRCIALGRTNLEQAIMWAVKGITTSNE